MNYCRRSRNWMKLKFWRDIHHLTLTVGLLAKKEVAKTVADPTFLGPVVCDDDRKSLGLSQRNHTPDAPPIWTPSSPHSLRQDCNVSSEPGNDHSNTEVGSAAPDPLLDGLLSSAQNGEFHSTVIKLNHQEDSSSPQVNNVPHGGTLSTSPTAGRDVCRAVPAHRERLKAFSTAGPAGVISSWTSPNAFSPPVHPPSVSSTLQRSSPSVLPPDTQPSRTMQLDSLPLSIPAHLEDCGRPTGTAVLGSRHKGIDSEAGTSSSRTALGSLPSRLRTSAAQGTSMRARRRRRDPVPQSSNATSARSDLAPEASLSSSDDFPIATSRSSGLPLSQVSNFPDVSLARKDAKTQAVKRIPKSMPQPPPSRLVPELLDKSFIRSDKASLDEDDPPCASGKARKCRSPKDYRISSRPRDTSSPDCFRVLSGNSVSGFGSAALEWQDHDFEDLVFFIPPDCPMSTPVASRKRASRKVACRES
ncbi:hypothetical protein F5888DRAFT_1123964 [Russula emetica]|nr:hypothetical protein F5888DRAFT_1123964 [Russula emetica]